MAGTTSSQQAATSWPASQPKPSPGRSPASNSPASLSLSWTTRCSPVSRSPVPNKLYGLSPAENRHHSFFFWTWATCWVWTILVLNKKFGYFSRQSTRSEGSLFGLKEKPNGKNSVWGVQILILRAQIKLATLKKCHPGGFLDALALVRL